MKSPAIAVEELRRIGFEVEPFGGLAAKQSIVCALMQAPYAAKRMEGDIDVAHASFFISRMTIVVTHAPGMAMWRKKLFVAMSRNVANPVAYFGLPDDRTIVMGSHVEL